MKKPNPKIRVFGQRSLPPSFLKPSSSMIPVEEEEGSAKVDKSPSSFSEFLDTKLNKSVLFKLNSLKPTPLVIISNAFAAEKNSDRGGLEKTMLQQFKPQVTNKDVNVTDHQPILDSLDQTIVQEELDQINVTDNEISKKRKDPFQGMESKNRTGRPVLVLGDDAKETKRIQRGSKKQRPTYNHYANGSGWWDNDMEGVDSEEVGHSEVWEGVGSTTFGDIVDWH